MRPLVSLTALALSAFLSVPAFAQKMDNNDAAAMKQLAQDNLNEIEAGKLAASKAQSPDVKQFGQKMADNHARMLEDLKRLAKTKDVAMPDKAALKDLAQNKQLERKSGADFDREFMAHMVKGHEKALLEANATAAKAKDPDFKSAAQQAAYKIQEHLNLAKRIAGGQAAAAGSTTGPITPTSPAAPITPSSPSSPSINPGINYSK
jgi:putative membrane protein